MTAVLYHVKDGYKDDTHFFLIASSGKSEEEKKRKSFFIKNPSYLDIRNKPIAVTNPRKCCP